MAVNVTPSPANKVFRWVPDPDRQPVNCGTCGGTFEPLKVQPSRSESYVCRVWMCDTCKTVVPEGAGRRLE